MGFMWQTKLTEDAARQGIVAEIADEEWVDGHNWGTAMVLVKKPETILLINANANEQTISVDIDVIFPTIFDAIVEKEPKNYHALHTYVEDLSPRQLLQAIYEDPTILEQTINTGAGLLLEAVLVRAVAMRFAEKLEIPVLGRRKPKEA